MTSVRSDVGLTTFEHPADALDAAVTRHELAPTDRISVDVGRGSGLRDAAGAGQILVASRVAPMVASLPARHELVDCGIHRLPDLSPPQRVFELRRAADRSRQSQVRSLDRFAHNLPIELTSFVGRHVELTDVGGLLTSHRFVTIAGPGGCGKTRLAAHVAAADIERWTDSVCWVELQSLAEAAAVPEAVATAAGVLVEPVRGALRSLTTHFGDRRILLCLDNCEHVLDAAAELVEALLRSCPDVTVLATSRQPLGVAGEAVWRVPTMAGGEALELFVERSSPVHPHPVVDEGTEAVLQRLCCGLDGIPLAIELAAAWTRTLSPQQIEAGLDDRFALLVRSSRGAAARHQTLEASMAWSYDLLDDRSQTVFRQLAIFRGGFTLDSARRLCGDDVLAAIDRLVDTSLVIAEDREGESRFRLLETIREYALRRLDAEGKLEITRDHHLDHLVELLERAEPMLDHDKDGWCAAIEPERDNLRAALDWGLSADDPERGRRLAAATAWLWNLRGRGAEGVVVLKRAIDRAPGDRTLLQARLLTGYALIGDTAAPSDIDPVRLGAEIAAELGDDRLRGRCLVLTAVGTFYRDFDAGWELCEAAVRCAEAAGDEFVLDCGRGLQGLILHFRDQHRQATELLGPVVDRLVRRGDRGIASTLLVHLATGAWLTGDLASARRLAEQASAVAEPLGDYHRVGTTRSQQALLLGVSGDVDGGLRMLESFLHMVEGAGVEVFVPGMALTLGQLHYWRGDFDQAIRWLTPDAPTAGDLADTNLDSMAMPVLAAALRADGRIDEAWSVLDHAEQVIRRLGMPRLLADVVEQKAHLATREEPDRATDLHHEALAIRVEHELRPASADSLEALGVSSARTNRQGDSVRILAAAAQARTALGCPRPPVDVPAHQVTLDALRTALGDAGFDAGWGAGVSMSLDEAVSLARRTRGRRGRPSTGWASLTPTELDVVRVAVEGLSNPDIAAKLWMSRGTVKTHLSHVYTKLGVANRTELATFAVSRLPRVE